ncbi:TetR/AcrR family transcriptional regulator [Nocardia puris]|uniref:TetR family transcriptional regulator n=2 Tax=Nocardia puris TaxID=208602 RepID=A0A366DA62_9NOCA|nr:TetR/AcrR family transcriptional regulator [Nocardia puris]MBF6365756.1 TetR/AcrR family transcriptional regulator [Nocardia puris]MBF6460601.1 TetR/AcrR family transcriptional regulator [Nocardia puris]RBO86930.1 TetR family transcriptional regulator [Nocardia puris]
MRPMTVSTPARERTRRAIMDAAVRVLARDPSGSLGDVATEAGVGRTTVHRYFPERTDLINAIAVDTRDKLTAAQQRARLDEGSALDALERLCVELFDLAAQQMLLTLDDPVFAEASWEDGPCEGQIRRTIERGRDAGELDAELDPRWVENMIWSFAYVAWMSVNDDTGMSRHLTLRNCLRTLRKALAP